MNALSMPISGLAALALALALGAGPAMAAPTVPLPSPAAPVLEPVSAGLVTYDQPVIALTHAAVIDGTGAPARVDQTLVVAAGRIAALGDAAQIAVPAGALVLDMTGKTLLPGFVMVHEHLFYPSTREYLGFPLSMSLLYLAGGETTIRTAGSVNGYADINLAREIAAGTRLGPDIDVTAPYLEGRGAFTLTMPQLANPAEVTRMVDYWAGQGATSFKAYMHLTRAQLAAAIAAAHRHGMKITGHLCAVTYAEAADLGIDNLEHGFAAATDFDPDKKPDACPADQAAETALGDLAVDAPAARALIARLVARHVALTSTLPVFEAFDPQHGDAGESALAPLTADYRAYYLRRRTRLYAQPAAGLHEHRLLLATMRLEKAFADAGGLLLAGSDPTGIGGVVPGFSAKRQFALLLEAGFTVTAAVHIMTQNGARFLGREAEVGTLAAGKRADIVVIAGDLTAQPQAIANMPLVFKRGVGVATAAVFERLKGVLGLW